jgi:hypothetical protein
VQSTSSVAWVSALIGLNERLPQSLTQISSRMRGRTGAFSPAAPQRLRQGMRALRLRPVRFAEREAVALNVLDDARFGHFAAG